MNRADLQSKLAAALAAVVDPSSDFDLNPDVVLPAGRMLRDAGVLVPIVARPEGATVILTKRSSALKHHPGQIAFPGGKVDPGDDGVIGAALREAEEEIGLPASEVSVLGTMSPHETVTAFQVTPVVALVSPGFTAVPEIGEVAEVFEVPLAHLTDVKQFSIQSRRWHGARRHYFTVPWGPYYIWGATARMLRGLADRMKYDPYH